MSGTMGTIPANTAIQPGHTIHRKVNDTGWESALLPKNKADIGLANVDNTSDLNKPVPTAVQTSLDGKANTVHSHVIADVTSLQDELDLKADSMDLADVAVSGSYEDLLDLPETPAVQVNADWEATSGVAEVLNKPELFSGDYDDLDNKPTLFSGDYDDLTDKPTLGTAASTNSTAYATAAQGTKADTAVQPASLATVATTGNYNDLSNKPVIPTSKRIETYVGTTNASGNYTVTYTETFPVTPDVQPQLQAGTPSQVVRITSSTPTGFTVQVTNRNSVTLLGIEVLLAASVVVSGASVGILVTAR